MFSKRLQLAFLLLAGISGLSAQSIFDGEWTGSIPLGNNQSLNIKVAIRGDTATQYFTDQKGVFSPVRPAWSSFRALGNNALLVWMISGGVWTETQSFSLAYMEPGKLHLVWTRHVNNRQEGQAGDDWNLRGEAILTSAASVSSAVLNPSEWTVEQGSEFRLEQGKGILEARTNAGGYMVGRVYYNQVLQGFPRYEVTVNFERTDRDQGSPMELYFLGGAFAINTSGGYYFWEHEGGQFSGWKQSSAIRTGINEIKLRHVGRELTAWVNGVQVDTFRLLRPINQGDNRISVFMKGQQNNNPRMAFWNFKLQTLAAE